MGLASSKFVAKVASDLDKPDGLVVVPPGTELDLLRPMHVTVIPGVGPATAERLRRAGIHTVADLETVSQEELVRLVGRAHGLGLHALARAEDDRPIEPERETKSVSVEGTYDTDLTDRRLMEGLLTRQAGEVAERLRAHGLSGRTVSIKVRLHDFTTLSRSTTIGSPTDATTTIARLARSLLADLDTSGGVRLWGWASRDLPTGSKRTSSGTPRGRGARGPPPGPDGSAAGVGARDGRRPRGARPGMGVGVGAWRRDRPVRDARVAGGPGALVQGGRPDAQPVAASRAVNRTSSPGRSCAQRARSSSSTTPMTG